MNLLRFDLLQNIRIQVFDSAEKFQRIYVNCDLCDCLIKLAYIRVEARNLPPIHKSEFNKQSN